MSQRPASLQWRAFRVDASRQGECQMNKIVEVATDVNAAPRTVWTALTARETALFPGSEVETDWVVGHSIEFSGIWRGKAYRDRGRVREFDRERKLTFDYWCD